MSALKYWLWLTTRRGLRTNDAFALLERFGTPEAVYFADEEEYEFSSVSVQCVSSLREKELDGAEQILADCDRLGLRILTIQDADYPERLRQLYDPPCVLYVKGKLFPFDEEVALGVVGTRSPSEYGKRMAGKLGLDLARSGALVISGIAQGLDSAALRGALSGGGGVVSVLGCGVDVIYPRENRRLYEDVASAGALISEFPPGTPPEGWHFPVRNRIISGLSVGVAVVEAGEPSGALLTARLALEQNREVFAFPGPADAPMSRGTNLLIQRGEAKLILSAADVLNEYALRYPLRLHRALPLREEAERERLSAAVLSAANGSAVLPKSPPEYKNSPQKAGIAVDKGREREYITLKDHREEFTDDERDILFALGEKSRRTDDLIEATQIPARRVSSALTMLQIRGYVEEKPGKRFEASIILSHDEG